MSAAQTTDLLIEIGCEDLPARYVQPLAQALGLGFVNGLLRREVAFSFGCARGDPRELRSQEFNAAVRAGELRFVRSNEVADFGGLRLFATPRRVAVCIDAVAERQADQAIERKGPQLAAAFRDGQPTPAALGFAKSCGVELAKLKKENGHLVFRKKQKGRRTADLIPEIFEETLKGMDALVPKRMRWGGGDETFVRPVHWLVAMHGSRVVPLQRFGLKTGHKTYGHRFHAPQAIALQSPTDYESALRNAKVWADFADRRAEIRRQIEAIAAPLGGGVRIDETLLDEVTALVEWPVALTGRFEAKYLELPPEVIIATVQTHQRYFPVFGADGRLLPHFITVANIESSDMAQVVAGNERVVRPRLADALFFWQQDRKQPLEACAARLAGISFQKDLGSIAERIQRICLLADYITPRYDIHLDGAPVRRAAELAKCDLATRMVFEFPELQGVMGGYYARVGGETETVALAISEHYLPAQSEGPIPLSVTGCIVALADKLDLLAGCFAVGQKPTASKDPFALRRAALGALRICIEGEVDVDLLEVLNYALTLQPSGRHDAPMLAELWEFVLGRFVGVCHDQLLALQHEYAGRWIGQHPGQAYLASWPLVEIVESVKHMSGRPADLMHRARAVSDFLQLPQAASLAAANKRARNLLKQAGVAGGEIDAARLEHPAERALAEAIRAVEADLAPLHATSDYTAMLTRLAALREPVDAFFESVMVMADDPALRANRLALLSRLDALCREVADLSQLPG